MTPELYKQLAENDLRCAIRLAIAMCEHGYKPTRGKEDLETPEEKALRRQYVLEDAKLYGPRP